MNNLSFNYIGDINLYLKNKDGTKLLNNQHNEGYDALFKLFAQLLAGVKINEQDLPMYIDIQYRIGNETKSCLEQVIEINQRYGYDLDKYVTYIEAMIQYQNISVIISDYFGASFTIVLLDYNKKALASSPIDYEYLNRIKPGTQMLVEWKLYVTNAYKT